MRYHALAALRHNALSVSCFLSFSVSSNQAHCLCLYASQTEDSAPGWLLPWFLFYLPTCALSAILHTCLSINLLQSPENYHCTQNIRICACKKRIRRIRLTGRASMRAGGYNEEGQCINAIARGKLGDPLSIEHWQVSEKCCLEWICCEKNHRKLTRTKATGKSFVFKPGVQL